MSSNLTKLINCNNCGISQLCLPYTLDEKEQKKLDSIIDRKHPMQKGEFIFEVGQPLKSLYALRSGACKSYSLSSDGEQQVTAFHLPGDIIGFDALATNTHQTNAVALETAMVCEIPFTTLDDLSADMPSLRKQITRLMSNEITVDQELIQLLTKKNAEQRMASFLLDLSLKYKAVNLSPYEFRLPMARSDIANYIGLTVETISRLLNRLQKSGAIDFNGKLISILDHDKLEALAGRQKKPEECHNMVAK